jgi:hypothetical protein
MGSPLLTGKAEQSEAREGGEHIGHSGEGAVWQAQLPQAGGGQQRLEGALLTCRRSRQVGGGSNWELLASCRCDFTLGG